MYPHVRASKKRLGFRKENRWFRSPETYGFGSRVPPPTKMKVQFAESQGHLETSVSQEGERTCGNEQNIRGSDRPGVCFPQIRHCNVQGKSKNLTT